MLPVKILIVEDQVVTAEQIKQRLTQLGYTITDCAYSSQEAIDSVQLDRPDIILMDIDLKGVIDGIQTVEKIKEEIDIPIIYLTALSDRSTMLRAGATRPANFLTKPFNIKDVQIAIDFAILNVSSNPSNDESTYLVQNSFFVKKKDFYEKINIKDILWIEAQGNYLNIYIDDIKPYYLSMTLKKFSQQFSHPSLLRINRSFIINKDKVEMIKGRQLVISGKSIPVSDSYFSSLEQFWTIIRSR